MMPQKTKKASTFQSRLSLLFSTIIKRWFQPFGLHTHCLTNSFVCNFLSSSAGFNLCSCFFPAHPCLPLSFPAFSGPSVPRPIAALLPLSDPRCFRFLSSASVLGSDYSASVSSFPFSSCFRLTAASSVLRFRFRFLGFPRSTLPGFPCIPSRFWYSASLYVSFRPSLLRSHSCSTGAYFRFRFRIFRFPSAFLSIASVPLPATWLSASSFPLFPFLPHSGFLGAPLRFRFPAFPVLSCLVSRAFLPGFRTQLSVVSFRPSLLRSHSCSTGAPLLDLSSGAGA